MSVSVEETQLPGELLVWVLIFSELLVFTAGLVAFRSVWLTDPIGFAEAQTYLNKTTAAVNTFLLFTSGYLAAKALESRRHIKRVQARWLLIGAAALGSAFLVLKMVEYAEKSTLGITYETHSFFMFYYLLTGFHAAHVLAGIVILLLVSWIDKVHYVQIGTQIWHMIDLIWILLFPVVYLMR